jgi:hypothetical protein
VKSRPPVLPSIGNLLAPRIPISLRNEHFNRQYPTRKGKPMKVLVASLATMLISSSVFAGNRPVPEIDGTLSVLMIALVGGLALMLKKKRD